ncbi:hypothetical protein Q8A67_019052 [Cirrhinus molitorella]|uniref:Uncharacterized protein n=1 Tax=Cirrhinus molitorella TaxID=172907 RepID=A0AA88TG17_9TELE|nr:hypothetical protein Q8A67_019052 [Cirrhinus molitorella]
MAERSAPRLGLTSNNSTLWVNLKTGPARRFSDVLTAERRCRWITGSLSGSDSRPSENDDKDSSGDGEEGQSLDTVISPFLVLLISSQDAAINIERVPEEHAAESSGRRSSEVYLQAETPVFTRFLSERHPDSHTPLLLRLSVRLVIRSSRGLTLGHELHAFNIEGKLCVRMRCKWSSDLKARRKVKLKRLDVREQEEEASFGTGRGSYGEAVVLIAERWTQRDTCISRPRRHEDETCLHKSLGLNCCRLRPLEAEAEGGRLRAFRAEALRGTFPSIRPCVHDVQVKSAVRFIIMEECELQPEETEALLSLALFKYELLFAQRWRL